MNGTSIAKADNETFIGPGDQMNHTRNATLDFTTGMNVYVLFTPDPTLGPVSSFKAEIGMRKFNRTFDEDDEDDPKKPKIIDVEIIEKNITLNEIIFYAVIVIGVIIYGCKKRNCERSWDTKPVPFDRHAKVVSTDVEEAELYRPEDDDEFEADKVKPLEGEIKALTKQ